MWSWLKQRDRAITLAIFGVWVLVFVFQVGRSTQHQEDRKQIKTAYKAGKSIKSQSAPDDAALHDPGGPQTKGGSHEASEIALFGIKAGEALLVLVTLLLYFATRDLVHGAEETAKRQLRAYLGLVDGKIDFEKRDYVISIQNNGQTPARRVKAFCNIQWYGPGEKMPADFDFPDHPQEEISGPITVGPGEKRPVNFSMKWDEFQMFNAGELAEFYIYGRFEYTDVFGDQWRSEFCYDAVAFGGGRGAIRVAARHNDTT